MPFVPRSREAPAQLSLRAGTPGNHATCYCKQQVTTVVASGCSPEVCLDNTEGQLSTPTLPTAAAPPSARQPTGRGRAGGALPGTEVLGKRGML